MSSQPAMTPFGSWVSPITAAMVAEGEITLAALAVSGDDAYWLEGRPTEGGRLVLVRRSASGSPQDVTPPGFNVRTRVHEYGGGAFLIHGDTVFFSNFDDQRLYRQDREEAPRPITPEPPTPAALRYADAQATPDGSVLICVRERHGEGGVVNELVALPADGSGEPKVVVMGNDFYSFPRPSPDGRRLAWTSWNHPNMPWDGTELWAADLAEDGRVSGGRQVAGGPDESIYQPEWSPDGVLHFVSDRTGWWNLYRDGPRGVEPLMPMEAEFAVPQWIFDTRTYAFTGDGQIVCRFVEGGIQRLGVTESPGHMRVLDLPYTYFPGSFLWPAGDELWAIAAGPTEAPAVVRVDLATGRTEVIKRSATREVDPGYVSVARPIEFSTGTDARAHALFYPPVNREHGGPAGERPPLVVMSHGGPTSAVPSALDMGIQFFTSRGIGVVDVNYRGSTGYGRAYRDALKGQWGVADVEDCVAAARHLVETGEADGGRLAIRGGSAGGFTTLAALTTRDDFAAGASYFGVGDLGALARDTHKFESRYLDGLVGPYPEAEAIYRERSPVEHVDGLSTPVILFQGLEDVVVPPAQAEQFVEACRRKGIPHAYLAFEGEQHGFRRAETIARSLEAELSFYGQIMGFEPADEIPRVPIEFLSEEETSLP
jgi:dipeptidyl aminopeptidase/acylaminoacyl peptidase